MGAKEVTQVIPIRKTLRHMGFPVLWYKPLEYGSAANFWRFFLLLLLSCLLH
jgi:hypothetical protein